MIVNKNAVVAKGYEAHKVAVLAYLDGLAADKAGVVFADVRKALNLSAEQLPDGHIHQLALDAGFTVKL